ncbi:Pyoverdine biosynthesis [Penicillium griseofulvum]|uniref:Pyoverdine biosynthesis n=1 Tax=Penicillium patulum TaxID=5078 RepID=A0A135LY38_PENPA|nr:Pyoverdine biosynthesis [Penicillium griseofulvum]KXG53870.1 Pyoverdine biosynthesis [Penicillium griseofulvum]
MKFEYDPDEVPQKVIEVLKRFCLHSSKDGHQKDVGRVFESMPEKLKINITANRPITMVLPAFPWKSPNQDKVLADGADLGEELGLAKLNHLCEDISKIYPYGARLILICDGPVYNDLVGVPDDECYDYGIEIRKIAQEKHFSSIQFVRLMNLLGLGDGEKISKADYLRLVATVREKLMSPTYFDPKFDIELELKTNPDTRTTYESYFSRISEDLKWAKGLDPIVAADPALYAAEVSKMAKTMINRLIFSQAYEAVINDTLGKYIRLSIHPSLGLNKVSIPLLGQGDLFGDMPWHASVAVLSNGEIKTGKSREFRKLYEVVVRHGRPYYFRERSPMYEWEADVEFQHDYDGLIVKNPLQRAQTLGRDDRLKLARLIVQYQTKSVRVEGFEVLNDA